MIVIGCPGSGKSTFSKKLASITNINLIHLDLVWNKSDKTTISREEFDTFLKETMNNESWIIDGNYQRTLEMRLQKCDTVFLLDYDTDLCLLSAKERVGIKRDDMPWIENELNKELESKIINFKENNLKEIYQLLKKYNNLEVIVFKNREESNNYIKKLEKNILH